MTPDIINGSFEVIGSVMLGRNVWQLYKDKIVRGVHWWATAFFAAWGYWNLFYYPHLDQWFSFSGGVAIVAINTVWLGQMLYYNWKERHGFLWQHECTIRYVLNSGVQYATTPGRWHEKGDDNG